MKVLMFGWELYPHISGGLGIACHGLTQSLLNCGQEIVFVLPSIRKGLHFKSPLKLMGANSFVASKKQSRLESFAGLQIEQVDTLLHPYMDEKAYKQHLEEYHRQKQEKGKDQYFLDIAGDYGPNLMHEVYRYAQASSEIAKRVDHDVIHCHDWLTIQAGIEAQKVSGKPLLFHVHALEYDRCGQGANTLVCDLERHGMHQADKVITVSHYTKNTMVHRYGVDPNKIDVVYNGLLEESKKSVGHISRPSKKKNVLFLGRVTFQKGPDYFVEAANYVLKSYPHCRFVMAGSGDMIHRMIHRVGELGIGKSFSFTGFLDQERVRKLYAMSDVYVMPSVSEPFGISPLEALAQNTPVILSKNSGVSETLSHVFKVDFWDIRDMASKIIALLKYPSITQELLKNAKKEIELLSWDKAARQIQEIYRQVA